MDNEEAKKIIEQERRERVEKCKAEIGKLLEAHKCRIEVMVILKAGQVIPQVDVVANE